MGIPYDKLPDRAKGEVDRQRAAADPPAEYVEPGGQVTVTLDWPPSVNHYWRHVVMPVKGIHGKLISLWAKYGGAHAVVANIHKLFQARVLISKDGREYRERMVSQLRGTLRMPPNVDLAADLLIYPPDRRARDLDNLEKAIWDTIQAAGIIENDCRIKRKTVETMPVTPGGQVVVTIRERAGQGRLL